MVTACEFGTGPVDAMCKAVNKIVQVDNDLTEFAVQSVTRGIDALGEVTIRVTDPDGSVHIAAPTATSSRPRRRTSTPSTAC